MKCISVPTSIEAMSRLDYDACIEGDLVDATITDEDYNSIVKLGLVTSLNELLDINIDDYEDEKIVGIDALTQAKMLIENIFISSESTAVNILLSQVNNAMKYKTGVFFYF